MNATHPSIKWVCFFLTSCASFGFGTTSFSWMSNQRKQVFLFATKIRKSIIDTSTKWTRDKERASGFQSIVVKTFPVKRVITRCRKLFIRWFKNIQANATIHLDVMLCKHNYCLDG